MTTSLKRKFLLPLLVAALGAACLPDPASAQLALTDGWSIFIYDGKPYLIPPGYVVQIVPLPDGKFGVLIMPAPPPPPPTDPGGGGGGGGGVLAYQAPAPGPDFIDANSVAEHRAGSFNGSIAGPVGLLSLKLQGQPVATPNLLLGSGHLFPREVLLPFSSARALEQLESDVGIIQSTFARAVADQRLRGQDFNRIRAAAFRIRDHLPLLVAATEIRAGDEPDSRRAKQKAVVALDSLVTGLEVLLPLLDEISRQALAS